VPTLLGLLVGIVLTQLFPREYVATATLATTLPSPSSALTSLDAASDHRLLALSDELLSDSILQQVAREERLADTDSLDEVVADIRSRTSISFAEPSSERGSEPDTLLLSYTAPTAELAERVANRMAQVVVEQQGRIRDEPGEPASALVGRQLELSQKKLEAAEQTLREAKASVQDPSSGQGTHKAAVDELRRRLSSATQAVAKERERLTALDQQIDAAKQAAAEASAAAELRARERVDALERKLTEARKQYTSQHPDVQRLEFELAQARADERAVYGQTPLADQPLQPLLTERDTARQRVEELEAAAKRTEDELNRSAARITDSRGIEPRLTSAAREYDLAKQEHQRLDEQYQEALRDESIRREQARKGAVLLAAAPRPEAPSSPSPMILIGGSLLIGLALGLAWAVGRELLDRTFYGGRMLEEKYGTPVLSEIPHF